MAGRETAVFTMSANNIIRTQNVSLCIRSSVWGPEMFAPSSPHIVVWPSASITFNWPTVILERVERMAERESWTRGPHVTEPA